MPRFGARASVDVHGNSGDRGAGRFAVGRNLKDENVRRSVPARASSGREPAGLPPVVAARPARALRVRCAAEFVCLSPGPARHRPPHAQVRKSGSALRPAHAELTNRIRVSRVPDKHQQWQRCPADGPRVSGERSESAGRACWAAPSECQRTRPQASRTRPVGDPHGMPRPLVTSLGFPAATARVRH